MRCYNGCPDSELQAFLDARTNALKRLKRIEPQADCVFFPMGGFYQVWCDNQPISIKSPDKLCAIEDAILKLSETACGK